MIGISVCRTNKQKLLINMLWELGRLEQDGINGLESLKQKGRGFYLVTKKAIPFVS